MIYRATGVRKLKFFLKLKINTKCVILIIIRIVPQKFTVLIKFQSNQAKFCLKLSFRPSIYLSGKNHFSRKSFQKFSSRNSKLLKSYAFVKQLLKVSSIQALIRCKCGSIHGNFWQHLASWGFSFQLRI